MNVSGHDFEERYEVWARADDPAELLSHERYLRANLREAWQTGDADARHAVLGFIQDGDTQDYDIMLAGLRDSDDSVARFALASVGVLVWKGRDLGRERVRQELEWFEANHPDWAVVCESILRRL